MGFDVGEGSVNGECTADFFDVPSGRYRVTVRGSDATNADDGEVEVNSVVTQDVEVRAKHTDKFDPSHLASNASFISVTELGIPSNAAKEFEKANRFIANQDWSKAADRLHKGLAIYPKYAAAYNNLGAAYYHRGNNGQARQALEQAIALDDHLAAAYANLARLSFLEKDYPSAESLFTKAVNLEPAASTDELFLLAYAEVTDHHLDQAIETSRQGHEKKLSQHGFLHLIAANAYEQQNRIVDSVSELQTYLAEEPSGRRVEKVKAAIATLQAQVASQSSVR
jgi:tetratricopeptide (TPR) repeat protein